MNASFQNKKHRFSFRTVMTAVIITFAATVCGAYFLGFLHFTHAGKNSVASPTADMRQVASEDTLYTCGMHPWVIAEEPGNCPICGMKLTPKKPDTEKQPPGEPEIAYWRAPMNPMEIYGKPGKSAMGMDLVPVYENELSGGVEINIDPVIQQNMGIRTARVEKGPLVHTIRTYGHITYDETRKSQINPKYNGWLEKIYVNFAGQIIKKGEPLFDIYSPDLIAAQEDYLEAYRNKLQYLSPSNQKLLSTVKRRLNFYGLDDSDIRAIEKKGSAQHYLTIRSPYNGVVTMENAVKGGYVKAGTTVYEIADLSRVWVEAHIYEYELPLVTTDLEAEMTLPYLPGKRYHGKIAYIYPYLQRQTRDVVIRLEFDNPDLTLKPDMYANVFIKTIPGKEGLYIPSEAVIRSGEQNIVFVTRGHGKFTPRQISLGSPLDNGNIQVLTGLAPGEVVVTSGQFLLDSESKLREATRKMLEPEPVSANPESADSDDFFEDF